MKKRKIFYGWAIVAATVLLSIIGVGLVSSILGLYLPSIAAEHGFSQTQVSSIITFCMVGSLIASLFLGKLFQKFSARKLILIFGCLLSLSVFLLSQVQTLVLMYSLAVLLGIGALISGALAVPVLITSWFDAKRGTALGIASAGAGFGAAIIAPIISSSIQASGYRAGFLTLGFILLGIIIISFLIIRDRPENIGKKPYGHNEGDPKVQSTNNTINTGMTFKEASKTPSFIVIAIMTLVLGFFNTGVAVQIPSYLKVMEFETSEIGLIIGLYSLLMGLGKTNIGFTYDRLGLVKSNNIFYTFMASCYVALFFVPQISLFAYLYVLLAGLGLGVNSISLPLVVSKAFGDKYYSSIYSIVLLLIIVGSALGTSGCGLIIDTLGYKTLFIVAAASSFVQLFLIQFAIKLSKNNTVNTSKIVKDSN